MKHSVARLVLWMVMMAAAWPAIGTACEEPIKEGQTFTRKGKLVDAVNIGGESTSWILVMGKGDEQTAIDVDMSAIPKADSYDDAQVTITGTMYLKKYVERGDVWIFKAKTIKRD